jgi:colanic acid biosynthesis protein WcaH
MRADIMTATLPPRFLSHGEVDTVIRLAPLIAIDLIIRSARDDVLLGLRKNEPAKGCYFVPGGMILKNERLSDAFARLAKTETDHAVSLDDARPIGVFEHFYDNNRSGNGGYGTHYVVLGYELRWPGTAEPRPDDQHSNCDGGLSWTYWPQTACTKMPKLISARAQREAAGNDGAMPR